MFTCYGESCGRYINEYCCCAIALYAYEWTKLLKYMVLSVLGSQFSRHCWTCCIKCAVIVILCEKIYCLGEWVNIKSGNKVAIRLKLKWGIACDACWNERINLIYFIDSFSVCRISVKNDRWNIVGHWLWPNCVRFLQLCNTKQRLLLETWLKAVDAHILTWK